MQPKKNPKADLTKSSGLFFAIGFALISALSYAGFEMKSYDRKEHESRLSDLDNSNLDEDQEEFAMEEFTPPPPPPPPPPVVEDVKVVENEEQIEETIISSTETTKEEVVAKVEEIEVVDEPEEEVDVPFTIIEDKPMFEGCEKLKTKKEQEDCFKSSLDKHVKRNFQYPQSAQEMNIQGKVTVTFRINKDGTVSVVGTRGPDKSLEAEARRIIEKLPKLIPGKQRGRPAAVVYQYPINFKLANQ
ncbi:energy transducer TonB [Capnocytophaga canis]|uniref:TonB-dependent receptor n=1 Tax=Capnocytophaga canis TaxID=1848903 RepID=A0A0B7HY85_9FLAO|nr:energy transducer TonB [Capnocytophaga canis]CEN42498.1 TonB-dependent receptor [Capnocytophaga canis]CEN46625.1 TonB-dependent receptor [Capnocytophaga canis]